MKQSLGEHGVGGIKQSLPCHSLAEAPAEEDSNQAEDPEAVRNLPGGYNRSGRPGADTGADSHSTALGGRWDSH